MPPMSAPKKKKMKVSPISEKKKKKKTGRIRSEKRDRLKPKVRETFWARKRDWHWFCLDRGEGEEEPFHNLVNQGEGGEIRFAGKKKGRENH